MELVDARTGLRWIDRDVCLRLLADEVVGRLAVVHGGAPAIFPVNDVLDGDDIVFRTDPGTKLDAVHTPRAVVTASAAGGPSGCARFPCGNRHRRR